MTGKMMLSVLLCGALQWGCALADSQSYSPLNAARTSVNERITGDAGAYTVDVETTNGIVLHEAGQSTADGESFVKAGSYAYPLANGDTFELKYVANEDGFQPESAYLPRAPVFPHHIPQFVLDQIEKAERERALGLPVDDGSWRPWEY